MRMMCSVSSTQDSAAVKSAIEAQGIKVRELKASKAEKDEVKAAVDELIALKAQLSAIDGTPVDAGSLKGKKKEKKTKQESSEESNGDYPFKMEELVNLCKRKGFIFPSSEIYSPFSGFYDYGPLGTEMKNNIKKRWWRDFVQRREDVVGLDSSIISSPSSK